MISSGANAGKNVPNSKPENIKFGGRADARERPWQPHKYHTPMCVNIVLMSTVEVNMLAQNIAIRY